MATPSTMALDMSVRFRVVLPYCPPSATFLSFPSLTMLYIVGAGLAVSLGFVVAFMYNSVRVFNRRIRTHSISNTRWVVYYFVIGLRLVGAPCIADCGRCLADFFRFGLYFRPNDTLAFDATFYLISVVLQACAAFGLCVALEHQWRFRSPGSTAPTAATAPVLPASTPEQEESAIAEEEGVGKVRRYLRRHWTIVVFLCLFVITVVLGYIEIWVGGYYDTAVYRGVYLGMYIVQRVPVAVLVIVIVVQQDTPDGPTKGSKAWLVAATVLSLANDLPPEVWGTVLPAGCPLIIASWVDVVFFFYLLSLVFYFLFLRAEYKRNMEETIWNTVSQIQDTFDFRSF